MSSLGFDTSSLDILDFFVGIASSAFDSQETYPFVSTRLLNRSDKCNELVDDLESVYILGADIRRFHPIRSSGMRAMKIFQDTSTNPAGCLNSCLA